MHGFAFPMLILVVTIGTGNGLNLLSKLVKENPITDLNSGIERTCPITVANKILQDYMKTKTNKDHDPEVDMNAAEIIEHRGYHLETYYVTTKDGYILTTYRIPYSPKSPKSKGKFPVLLVHGFLADSSSFVISPTETSIAFWLVNQGYDVWLANLRGTDLSKNHTTLNPNKPGKYWKFSYYEMAIYDVPAIMKQIQITTGKDKMFYIGHSQGSLIFWVAMAERPELNKQIKAMFALGPALSFMHVIPVWKAFCYADITARLVPVDLTTMPFQIPDSLKKLIEKTLCGAPSLNPVCNSLWLYLGGLNYDNIDETVYASIIAHLFQGTSYMDIRHICQNSLSEKFRKYDYGEEKNKKIYKSAQPPSFNLTKVTCPVHLYSGTCDMITSPADTKILASKLGKKPSLTTIPRYAHLCYLTSKDAVRKIFTKILEQMKASI